ncbi:hypothetical protein FB451DRAFT_468682 [Mycena latifolia]|nr:hypothetical protein FB451DRAFT_468682 [Mycena latifolia]
MDFTAQKAKDILTNRTEIFDHICSLDKIAKFELSFSMTQSAVHELVHTGLDVASTLKSVLNRLGRFSKFVDTLLTFGVVASEVNPVTKAVLASVEQLRKMLEAHDKCEEDIRVLLEDMADSLDCIADVRQFVRSAQLKRAFGEVDPLMREAVNFLARYISQSPSAKMIAFVTFSTETENELASLTARFLSFKRKFDRGLAVQSGMAIMEIRHASASMEEHLKSLLDESVLRREDDILERLKSRSLSAT